MSNVRRIGCLLVVLSLCLAAVPGAAPVRAVSPVGSAAAISTQKLQEDRRSYLDSVQSTHGTPFGRAIVNPEASDGDMFAGVRVPPEVLSGLKNATTLDAIITIPGAPSVAQYAARQGTSISHLTAGDAAPVIAAERGAQEQTIHAIAAAGIGLSRLERASILVNRITGTVAKSQFSGLVQVVGAANVHIARIYTINDAASNELIGSGPSGVWTDPGVDGTGMYVGVVGFLEFTGSRTVVNPLRVGRSVMNELESGMVLGYLGLTRQSAQVPIPTP